MPAKKTTGTLVEFPVYDAEKARAEMEAHEKEHAARSAATFTVGDIVELQEDYSTRTTKGVLFVVRSVPNPSARKKAEREGYLIEPVLGGRGSYCGGYGLKAVTGPRAEQAKAKVTEEPAERWATGTGVRITPPAGAPRTLKGGAKEGDVYVVLDENTDGTYKVAALNGTGEGRYYPKLPRTYLTRVTLAVTE